MLRVEERFVIRELYGKGVSISEIARQTGRDRKSGVRTLLFPFLGERANVRLNFCRLVPVVLLLLRRSIPH